MQLGEVCEFIRGVTFDKNEATTMPAVGKIPILRAGNIGEELDAKNDLVWVPETLVDPEQHLRRNDIAICMSSGSPEVVGKTARAASNLHASVGSFCGIIRPKKADQAAYLSFFFRSPAFYKHRDAIARGANIQNLRFSQFEEIELEIPGEQNRIARLLEQADRLRRTRRYDLELSDTFLPAAFNILFGDLNTNTGGWNSVAFDEVCAIDAPLVDPRKPEYRNLPHIGGDNIEPVTGRIVHLRTAAEDGLISAKFLIDADHILFSKIRPKLRKVSEPKMVALCSADIYPIRTKSNALNPRYLAGFLRSEYFTRIVSSLAESRTNIPKVNREELSDLPVFLPPIAKQKQFSVLVERHKHLRANQREALRQADHLFQSLLHRAFS